MTLTTSETVLRRVPRTPRHRAVALYDAQQGVLLLEDGTRIRLDPLGPLSGILRAITPGESGGRPLAEVIYVVAATYAQDALTRGLVPDWYKEPAALGWAVTYRHDSNPARRVAICRLGSVRVDVRHTAAWFGDYTADLRTMRLALLTLASALRNAPPWGAAVLLGTPAQTGQALLQMALPHGAQYPALDPEFATTIYANLPQARREVLCEAGQPLEGFFYYDQRFAYAACLRNVPNPASVQWRKGRGRDLPFDPLTPGFYGASWRVPAEWRGAGVLAVKEGSAAWVWPRESGKWFYSWASGAELEYAIRAGYTVHVHEAIEFPIVPASKGYDPLRTWAGYLRTLFRDFERIDHGEDALYAQVDTLARAMIRHIVLDTIGSFHRRGTDETSILPIGTSWDAVMSASDGNGPRRVPWGWEVTRRKPLDATQAAWARPEWSASIWGVQRSRIAKILRELEGEGTGLLGVNTDAVYTTRLTSLASMHDAGEIGNWRLKGEIPTAARLDLRTPGTLHELAALAHQGEFA